MIDLRPEEHEVLRLLARAGDDGLPLAEVGAAYAIRLGLEKFVRITKDEPQHVIVTQEGVAFLRRVAFA